jgi:hypothetical protein
MTEILIAKKNVVMDSQIMTRLMECERLTEFQFVHNLVPISGKSNSLEIGSLIHKMLEAYYKNIRDGFPRANAVSYGLAAGDDFILHGDNGQGLTNTPAENTKHKNGSLDRIGYNYAKSTFQEYCDFYIGDSWTPLEVETVKGEVIYEDDEIRLLWKAKLDLTVDTNQGIFSVDHKTMRQRRDTLSLNNQFMGQCVLMKTRNVIINKIGFQQSLKLEEKFTRHVISYSASRLVEWLGIAAYYAKYLVSLNETNYFPPRFSHCDKFFGCAFKDVCEADTGMREETIRQKFMKGTPWSISDED